MKNVYIIEGLDRLGKTTLISNIRHKYGYYEVIHFEKPQLLNTYELEAARNLHINPLRLYQLDSFANMFRLARSGARIIFDRAHLGEMVYAPLYRMYAGDFVFDLERTFSMGDDTNTRLILLTTSDFTFLTDDGLSFDVSKRDEEQKRFIDAFNRSIIRDKIIIDVHNGSGGFRSPMDILEEATR